MWKEIKSNCIEKVGNKILIFSERDIKLINLDDGKVCVNSFNDLPPLIVGRAKNIRKGEKFSVIHNEKLYFIAEFQEDYHSGDSLVIMDLESGDFKNAFFMDECISEMELSDLMLDSDDACFCIGTIIRGESYTQCIVCPEPGFIWGISKHTGELEPLNNVDDIANDIRVIMEDYYDGCIHYIMGKADQPKSEYKSYKGLADTVVADDGTQ